MEEQATGWIRIPLNEWQILVLSGASNLYKASVTDLITNNVNGLCHELAPRVYAKELMDYADAYANVTDETEEGTAEASIRQKAIELADEIAHLFPEFVEVVEEEVIPESPEINWLENVIKESKEYKYDPDGPKDIRDR